ncbi:MAG: response regulator transcription factor [Candidatus Kapabacteria bacterium]|nr:response regulator transcription factor [Candidatus Kapabacteria bacterium]
MHHILLIEDDPAITLGLQDALTEELFNVSVEHDGARGYTHALESGIDCIILDVMLPSMNGKDVCRKLREQGIATPIIMLTSKGEEADKVLGLELGADDYVTKPFSVRELIARIKAHLRRTTPIRHSSTKQLTFGNIEVNFTNQELLLHGKPVKLSAREFEVLHYLIEHEGTIVTREMLLDNVWGYNNFPTTRTVDNYILMLRKKLEENPAHPKHILTLHTQGYKFVR